jgi:ABC-2 type transport system ATP-binding protein
VGALVDGPGFVPHLSGRKNLELAQRMIARGNGKPDLERAVAMAGLGEALERPYRTYSHGMRYRLGLAQALLGNPDLLLLDEPTTGLDPAHILEVRDAIRAATASGTTVVFSSHVMADVEQLCTHAAVMAAGKVIANGPIDQLLADAHASSLQDVYLGLMK